MLLFLNISGGEILVIVVVVYLVFGPKKIPELARMLGKGINELRRATNEIKREINVEVSGLKHNLEMEDEVKAPAKDKTRIKQTTDPASRDNENEDSADKSTSAKHSTEANGN